MTNELGSDPGGGATAAADPKIDAITARAHAKIGRKPGRPVGSKKSAGDRPGVGLESNSEGAHAKPDPVVRELGALVHGEIVGTVKDYRSLGKLATKHPHWDIDEEGAQAGARVVETVLARLPAESSAKFLSYFLALRSASVGYAVFVLPIVKSVELAQLEKTAIKKREQEKQRAAAAAAAGETSIDGPATNGAA